MSKIKSEKAKERIAYYCSDMDITYPLSNEQVEELIQIAEHEAEERHAKALQELKDKAIHSFCEIVCRWIDRDCNECKPKMGFTQKLNKQ